MGNNAFEVTLESEAFSTLKSDFNQVLVKTLANMKKKESEHAEITLKLTIDLAEGTAPDFENSTPDYRAERDIVKPMFSHKVSSLMKIKDEKSGVFSGDYELVWDDEKGSFIIRAINNGQMSLFDEEEQENVLMLEAPKRYLPEVGSTSCADEGDGIIEADHKEVPSEVTELPEDIDDYSYEEPDND